MDDAFRGFKAAKCFEGNGPLVIFSVSGAGADGMYRKGYLVADATQRSFGVRLEAGRGEDLKQGGAFVNLLRKHARTAGIGRISRDPATGHVWLPLFTSRGEVPDYWVELAKTAPPEVRLVEKDGTLLIRKSSQGTYTKRRPLAAPLPAYPPGSGAEDLTDELARQLAALPAKDGRDDEGGAPDAAQARAAADASAADATAATVPAGVLPEYQRDVRDRLARRLKTVRKTLAKFHQQAVAADDVAALVRQAELLQAYLHIVPPGAAVLELDHAATGGEPVSIPLDAEQTPGQNLAALFERVKKARRAQEALGVQVKETEREVAAMSADLARLRASELPLATVHGILKRYRLPLVRPEATEGRGREASISRPYRLYEWRQEGSASSVKILVGKGASESDELCRQAKSNDYWVHVVGTTGSHVIIPARQVQGPLDAGPLRAAAILALHHSKLREDHRGEVYVSRRQFIRKRKGMAPGLWSVDKAETLLCAYDGDELQQVLAMVVP